MTSGDVTAVIVTRGDVDLDPVLEPLGQFELVVYDNSGQVTILRPPGATIERGYVVGSEGMMFIDGGELHRPHPDLSVYGRYAAIEWARGRLILVQDDDCVLPPESIDALLSAWQPGYVVCNMPQPFRAHYSDSALVGFGAVFERDLPRKAFERMDPILGMTGLEPRAPQFLRCCDVVFTTLTPRILVDVPYVNLPYATGPDRMYRQRDHGSERARMLDLARKVRDR